AGERDRRVLPETDGRRAGRGCPALRGPLLEPRRAEKKRGTLFERAVYNGNEKHDPACPKTDERGGPVIRARRRQRESFLPWLELGVDAALIYGVLYGTFWWRFESGMFRALLAP